jgi:hypothetical protein
MILTIVFTQSFLEDLRFLGSKFTWTNRQCNSPILEKLDGVLVNIKLFLASEAIFLHFGIFNHSSMLVKLASMPKRKTPFKFFFFGLIILNLIRKSEAWEIEVFGTTMFIPCKKLKHVKIALRDFNKKFLTKILDRVYIAKKAMEDAQSMMQ